MHSRRSMMAGLTAGLLLPMRRDPIAFSCFSAPGTIQIADPDHAADATAVSRGGFVTFAEAGILGDGSDETAKIQTLLNTAAGKRTVVVSPAVSFYGVSAPLDLPAKSILIGTGAAGEIRNIHSAGDADIPVLRAVGAAHIRIRNLAVRGAAKNIGLSFSYGCGILLTGCSDVIIEGCILSYHTREAIAVNGESRGIILRANYVTNGSAAAIAPDITCQVNSDATITDVLIADNFCLSANGAGIAVQHGDTGTINRVIVQNNIIENKLRHGIYTYSGTGSPLEVASKLIISGNHVSNVGWMGIYLNSDVTDAVIDGNYVDRACQETSGSSIPYAAIAGQGTGLGRGWAITGNIVNGFNGKCGIKVRRIKQCTISGNVVKGDGVPQRTSYDDAIAVVECDNTIVNGNSIALTNAEGAGIHVTSTASDSRYVGNIVTGNTVDRAIIGVSFEFQEDGRVVGNVIQRSTLNALELRNTSGCDAAHNTLSGIRGAENAAIRLSATSGTSDRCHLSNNILVGSSDGPIGIWIDSKSCRFTTVLDNDLSGLGTDLTKKIVDAGIRTMRRGNRFGDDPLNGFFTLGKGSATLVINDNISHESRVTWSPVNQSAGRLAGSGEALFLADLHPGKGFIVATSNRLPAGGGEIFSYQIEQ